MGDLHKELLEIGRLFCKKEPPPKPCEFCGQTGEFCCKACGPHKGGGPHKGDGPKCSRPDIEWALRSCKNEFCFMIKKRF